MLKRLNKNKNGFTIIELVIVISVISLFFILSIIGLNITRRKSRDSKRLNDVKQIQEALDLYFNDKSFYPASLRFDSKLGSSYGSMLCFEGFVIDDSECMTLGKTYMPIVPKNPLPRGIEYTYKQLSSGLDYELGFVVEGRIEDLSPFVIHYGHSNGIK